MATIVRNLRITLAYEVEGKPHSMTFAHPGEAMVYYEQIKGMSRSPDGPLLLDGTLRTKIQAEWGGLYKGPVLGAFSSTGEMPSEQKPESD
jgi:hypothetical protein